MNRKTFLAFVSTGAIILIGLGSLITEVRAEAANTETIDSRIGKLQFELGVPTKATVEKIYDEMDFQRAVQCYLWGIPTVGME